jgi:methionyl-tRNA formyltransferase
MKIIFFGTPKEVIPVIENLVTHFEVVAVVTTPDKKTGRKQIVTPTPIKIYAEEKNIPVLTPQQFTDGTIEQLQNFKPDLIVVAAYGKIVPNIVLHIPTYGAINIHPSLLPKYRGPTPIQTALLNGDEASGITFIQMDEQMDHGPILQQIPFTLEKTDTFAWLMQSTFAQAAQILPHVINEYTSGKLKTYPQNESLATYTKMITKDDGYIDLANPPTPEQLDRMIRAYDPWPTVWTKGEINDKKVLLKFLPGKNLQVEGKKPLSVKDFLNGYPIMKEIITKLIE